MCRILTPEDPRRGSRRLLFDVVNRGNRLALANFNRVPRPIAPGVPLDIGDGFLMRRGYTVVWCGWQHDVPAVEGLMRIQVPEAQSAGHTVSGKLLVSFQPNAPTQVQLLSDRAHRAYPSKDLNDPQAVLLVRDNEGARRRWCHATSGRLPGSTGAKLWAMPPIFISQPVLSPASSIT